MNSKKAKLPDSSEAVVNKSDLDEFIGYNLKRAYMLVRSDFRATVSNDMGEDGLSPTSLAALSDIVQSPGITQSELSRQLGIERSGLVSIIDDLQGREFIARTPVPGDRRVQALVPLTKGKAAYDKTLTLIRAHEKALFKHFTKTEKQQLLALLGKLREHEIP